MRTAILQSFNPYLLSNTAARYSLDGAPGDASYIVDGSNLVQLIADRSGNSAFNGLVMNGTSGNYASSPDSVPLSIVGDIDIRAWVVPDDWTPAAVNVVVSKRLSTGNQISYVLRINTDGVLQLLWSPDGTAGNAVLTASTVAPSVSNFSPLWIRATLDVDNGASGYTVVFYTSPDGVLWSQLGSAVVGGAPTSIFDGTATLNIGGMQNGTLFPFFGVVHRAQVLAGINGTLVFDADFTRVSKLAASFTESSANAATVTINSSGDLGARICGARDLVQLTGAKQPVLSVVGGRNIATFDGTNDYVQSAPFSLAQPVSVYDVFAPVAHANNRYVRDGGSDNAMLFRMTAAADTYSLSTGTDALTVFPAGSRAIASAIYNGASSRLRRNLGTVATGTTSGTPNGLCIGEAGTTKSFASNIAWAASIVRTAADPEALELRINAALMRQFGVAG